jgi:hypothetical protein
MADQPAKRERMIERKSRHPDAMPFFVAPPAWVLVHEAARFAQPGQAYHVMAAAQTDGSLFRDPIMVVADNSTCDGVGLFDPEFGQWHVVTPPEC